jgi:hypothetical protein
MGGSWFKTGLGNSRKPYQGEKKKQTKSKGLGAWLKW